MATAPIGSAARSPRAPRRTPASAQSPTQIRRLVPITGPRRGPIAARRFSSRWTKEASTAPLAWIGSPSIWEGTLRPRRSRIVGARSIERTYPRILVESEVGVPSKPAPAMPRASWRFGLGGGRSIAIRRRLPRRRRPSLASPAKSVPTTVTFLQRRWQAPAPGTRPASSTTIVPAFSDSGLTRTLTPAAFSVDPSRPGTTSAGAESARCRTWSQTGPGTRKARLGPTIGM